MNRRNFIQLSTNGTLGTLLPIRLISPKNASAINPFIWQILKKFAFTVAVDTTSGVLTDLIVNALKPSSCYSKATEFMQRKKYEYMPEMPIPTYTSPPSIGSPKTHLMHSGVNDYLAVTFAKQNSKGYVMSTQTAFMFNQPKQEKLAAFIPEDVLVSMITLANQFRNRGYSDVEIQQILLPIKSLGENSVSDFFSSSTHKTELGMISFENTTTRDNGMDKPITSVSSLVRILPSSKEKEKSIDGLSENLELNLPNIDIASLLNE